MSGPDDHRTLDEPFDGHDIVAYFYGGTFDGCPANVDHHCPHFNGPTTHIVDVIHSSDSFAFHVD